MSELSDGKESGSRIWLQLGTGPCRRGLGKKMRKGRFRRGNSSRSKRTGKKRKYRSAWGGGGDACLKIAPFGGESYQRGQYLEEWGERKGGLRVTEIAREKKKAVTDFGHACWLTLRGGGQVDAYT